nr:MAG TPA: hypothetical protein [Caudoviricetes sp.]
MRGIQNFFHIASSYLRNSKLVVVLLYQKMICQCD